MNATDARTWSMKQPSLKGPWCAMIGALIFSAPCFASDVIVESRSVSSWQSRKPVETQSADKWIHLQAQVQALDRQVQELQESSAQIQRALDVSLAENSKLSDYVTEKMQVLEQSLASLAMGQGSFANVQPMSVAASAKRMVLPNDEQQAYAFAYELLEKQSYTEAMQAFLGFAQTFEDSEHLPNAHYWIGEIYLLGGDLNAADASFELVTSRYPDHPKAADALLKRGYVQYTLEDWTMAKAFFNDVKARFEGTSAARLAQARLVQMKQNKQF